MQKLIWHEKYQYANTSPYTSLKELKKGVLSILLGKTLIKKKWGENFWEEEKNNVVIGKNI